MTQTPTPKEKKALIDKFLARLGNKKKSGFTIICNECHSTNVIKFDDTGEGSEYTGMYGEAGFKCKDCGNAQEIISH